MVEYSYRDYIDDEKMQEFDDCIEKLRLIADCVEDHSIRPLLLRRITSLENFFKRNIIVEEEDI